MPTVAEFTDQYAPSSSPEPFLYHVTTEDRLPSIRDHGLDPSATTIDRCPAELALRVFSDYAEEGLSPLMSGEHMLPFDRRESVFAWPSLPMDTVYDGGAIVVIRASRLDNRMFVANHDVIDGLIMSAPSKQALTAGDVDAVEECFPHILPSILVYLQSVIPIQTAEELLQAAENSYNPEVVIKGQVPTTAIETVLTPDQMA